MSKNEALFYVSWQQALVFYRPKRIAITGGYHGCHATIEVFKKIPGNNLQVIDIDDEFQKGDLCWLETPLNPIGVSRLATYFCSSLNQRLNC